MNDKLQHAIRTITMNTGIFRDDFSDWLRGNFDLWSRFETEAKRVLDSGRDHYSAYTIIEYLRHHTLLADRDSVFKLDQHWTSSMARLFALLNPEGRDLFSYRQRGNSVVGALPA